MALMMKLWPDEVVLCTDGGGLVKHAATPTGAGIAVYTEKIARLDGTEDGHLHTIDLTRIARKATGDLDFPLGGDLHRTGRSNSADKHLGHGVNVDLFATHHDD